MEALIEGGFHARRDSQGNDEAAQRAELGRLEKRAEPGIDDRIVGEVESREAIEIGRVGNQSGGRIREAAPRKAERLQAFERLALREYAGSGFPNPRTSRTGGASTNLREGSVVANAQWATKGELTDWLRTEWGTPAGIWIQSSSQSS